MKYNFPRKYGNAPSLCGLNHSHRSKLESSVCGMYWLRMKAGEIASIEVEKHIRVCGPEGHECRHDEKVELVIDFVLTRPDGSKFFGEAKGYEDQKWPLKKRLWKHNRLGELEIWGGTHVNPKLMEHVK